MKQFAISTHDDQGNIREYSFKAKTSDAAISQFRDAHPDKCVRHCYPLDLPPATPADFPAGSFYRKRGKWHTSLVTA